MHQVSQCVCCVGRIDVTCTSDSNSETIVINSFVS